MSQRVVRIVRASDRLTNTPSYDCNGTAGVPPCVGHETAPTLPQPRTIRVPSFTCLANPFLWTRK